MINTLLITMLFPFLPLQAVEDEQITIDSHSVADKSHQEKESLEEFPLFEIEEKEEIEEKKQTKNIKETKKASNEDTSNWMTVSSTAYTAYCEGCSGITYTGLDVRNTIYHQGMRIIAVDPAVIPLHSVVEIKNGDQTFKAVAKDIGGAINGKEIDLLVADKKTAYQWGVRDVEIRILK